MKNKRKRYQEIRLLSELSKANRTVNITRTEMKMWREKLKLSGTEVRQLRSEISDIKREQQVLPLLMSVMQHEHPGMRKYTLAVDFCIDSHLRALWRISPHDHAAEVRRLCDYYADQMAREMFKQIMEQRASQFSPLTNGF